MAERNPPTIPVEQLTSGPGTPAPDPRDPAAPMYRLLARLRQPLTLREVMIQSVRTTPDPAPGPDPLFPHITTDELRVPSPLGPIRCQVFRPESASARRPLLLYAHGGGFLAGRSEDTAYVTRKLAARADVVVVSVNYRLAPEFPFPAGLDDCQTVYRWLRTHGGEVGGDPERVGVAGDSSGGNFAAVLPLRARDHGLPPPAAVVLLGPVCDLCFEEYPSYNQMAPTGIVYDAAFMGFLRGAYVRYPDWTHPHVSPIRADLRGYPPALVIVGTADPMLDSACAFARKLREAGSADVHLAVKEAMPSGFYFFPGLFPDEDEAYSAAATFLHRYLHGARQAG